MNNISPEVEAILRGALAEDLGDGDITTDCTVPPGSRLRGYFVAKAPGVVAGLAVATRALSLVDTGVRVTPAVEDGQAVAAGTRLAEVDGPGRALLSGERVALNCLQRMSGIATLTRRFVDAVAGTRAIILDTRKTAPGLRVLEKWAVRLGGGQNHRAGLYDMVLIKDNHIAAAGGQIAEAVARVRACDPRRRPIEVEVRTLDELQTVLTLNVDRILLDNMPLDLLRAAVALAAGRAPLEASGNISLDNVAAVAATGVDYLSIGALTHSAPALDISLKLFPLGDCDDR
ncbi:MAG: carboxylating nicotinate-nucleotide diphosphorylase [Anaerolineales bacterium]|nr:carboxylating nicotinate-nucleotide diphosphorylase [Anaerolineales bacterium]